MQDTGVGLGRLAKAPSSAFGTFSRKREKGEQGLLNSAFVTADPLARAVNTASLTTRPSMPRIADSARVEHRFRSVLNLPLVLTDG